MRVLSLALLSFCVVHFLNSFLFPGESTINRKKSDPFNHQQSVSKQTKVMKWLPIGLILLLATALRIYQIGTEGLWTDEMLSISTAESFTINQPGSRPLYFILLNLWLKLGTSDSFLRSLSVFFGVGSIFLTYQIGLRVSQKSIALIAALLMTLSPLFLWHSQEIRYYTLSTFVTLASTLAMIHTLESPSNLSLGCWSVSRLLAIFTTPLNVTLLLPDILVFSWQFRKQHRQLFKFAIGLLFIAIAWFPAASELATVSGPEYMSDWANETPKPSISNIIARLTAFTVFWPPAVLKAKDIHPIVLGYYQVCTLALLGLLLIALLIAYNNRHHSPKSLWLVAWAFIPASSILFISYIQSSIWLDRYLLFIAPYIFVLLAAGFLKLWNWKRRFAIAISVIYLVAVSGGIGNYYTVLYRDNWHGLVQTIQSYEKPKDVIVYYAPWSKTDQSLTRYYNGKIPVYHIWESPRVETWGDSLNEQILIDLSPVKSRLLLVCWQMCSNKDDIQSIGESIAGKGFHAEQVWSSRSPITPAIRLFVVTPDLVLENK